MKLNIFDSHLHTQNSPDGVDSLRDICNHAMASGVMGIAVTDHYDCDVAERFGMDARMARTFADIDAAREQCGTRLRITKGIELGQGHQLPQVAEKMLAAQEFDLVLGSLHTAKPGMDIGEINFDDPSVVVSDILAAYFEEQYRMAQWGRFDVLAHLGFPERYIWGKYRIPVDFSPYEELIRATLQILIDTGKGLEINTSGYRQGLGKTIPVMKIIKQYYQMGGRIVTLGSDAHCAADVASDFGLAMDMLTAIGFEYFAFYRRREPVMLKLL